MRADTDPIGRLLRAAREILPQEDRGACPSAAAILDEGGAIHRASTITSPTPGLAVCALRGALSRARAEGSNEMVRIALVHPAGAARPCGLCLQALSELAPGASLVLAGAHGGPVPELLGDLLPDPFRSIVR